ncbi:MAG: DUF6036 family nucleotidyltransferase [Vicinamibacteria bacterium]
MRLLGAQRVEYLLIGGYAVALHGYPRATVDLDIWVRVERDNAARIVAALHDFGFDSPLLAERLFLLPDQIVRFGVPPFRIELLTSIAGVDFDACRARAVLMEIDGLTVPVISLDDLKINKRAAGRHKDLADLEYLP